jgi:hypothetical protein
VENGNALSMTHGNAALGSRRIHFKTGDGVNTTIKRGHTFDSIDVDQARGNLASHGLHFRITSCGAKANDSDP